MKRVIGEVAPMPPGAGMMGSQYCWGAQFRRYQQIEALEKEGCTHIKIGSQVSRIHTAKQRAMFGSGGICGLYRRKESCRRKVGTCQ